MSRPQLSAADRDWLAVSRRASGVPERVSDTAVIARVVGLVKGGQPARREGRRRAS
jgi:hypothetical protein